MSTEESLSALGTDDGLLTYEHNFWCTPSDLIMSKHSAASIASRAARLLLQARKAEDQEQNNSSNAFVGCFDKMCFWKKLAIDRKAKKRAEERAQKLAIAARAPPPLEMKGFEQVMERARFGITQTKELLKLLKGKRQLEMEYATGLVKLAATSLSTDTSPGQSTTGTLIGSLTVELQHRAQVHQGQAGILSQLIITLEGCLEDQEVAMSKQSAMILDSFGKFQRHVDRVHKLHADALIRRKQQDALAEQDTSCMTDAAHDDHSRALRKARQAALAANLNYKHQVERAAELHVLWVDDMITAFRVMERTESGRLTCLGSLIKQAFFEWQEALKAEGEFVSRLKAEGVDLYEAKQELQSFIKIKGTGMVKPEPPQYEDGHGIAEVLKLGNTSRSTTPAPNTASKVITPTSQPIACISSIDMDDENNEWLSAPSLLQRGNFYPTPPESPLDTPSSHSLRHK